VAGFSSRRFGDNGHYKLETKVTGSEPMESSRKRGQGSLWSAANAEETGEESKMDAFIKHETRNAFKILVGKYEGKN
jgi:hypothetical protein